MICVEHWMNKAVVFLWSAIKTRCTFRRRVFAGFCLLLTSLPAHALRDDVLVIVNDNSVDSPQVGDYYRQQRGINPANIVHVNVPDSYFISWDDFRRLRDQLIRFMQISTLDDPLLTPVVCTDGEPPYYCQASMDQLRTHTRIRYLVTTRGVPTRMTVDGSTLSSPNTPTSVDNYLKYWLINYFTDDVKLGFSEREVAFGDGGGMRLVDPAIDRELIVGRIDGLDLNAARALVDRAMAVEAAGIYGSWYGSTQFWRWKDANTGASLYPRSGSSVLGWRYALGLWGEDRAECADYLNFSGALPEGKAPAHCRVKLNDDADVALQTNQGINYPAPGNTGSREPQVVDALGYQGWLDGQATVGGFGALLNWRKDDQCTVTLCDNAADPAACRQNSSDILGELNTDCVGVADGFMGYNHTSYPLSYFTLWPTGWSGAGSGDFNSMAFPEVRSDSGFDDSFSLWFRNTDQVADPLCYPDSDFSLPASTPCPDARQLQLSQSIVLGDTPFDAGNPATYQVSLQYQGVNINQATPLRVRLFVHETGAGSTLINYGLQTLATLPAGDTGWTPAAVQFPLDPQLHNGASYDRLQLVFDTAGTFSGDLGIDTVSVQLLGSGAELAINGSFADGHRQVATGDHAANFLNRLGGVAFWGSVGHHQSGGCAFCFNGLESMVYFLRGLPLGDAVWFNESNNSGMLYGDPLYSPVSVRLNPVSSTDIQSGSVDLFGNTVIGRDLAQVSTSYRVDVCPGNDFYSCDQAQSWQPTGISGAGGSENALLGTLDTTLIADDDYTYRLQVNSLHTVSGRSQTIADYIVAPVNDPPIATDGILNTAEDIARIGILSASDEEGDALSYSIVSNGAKGTAVITNTTAGLYSYTPNPDATGVDSFTFKANDGQLDSNIANVSVNIAAVNDSPVASDASLTTVKDVIANASLSASDVDGDALTYNVVSNGTIGTATITNAATGAYTYTPNPGASGEDSFTFKVNDGLLDSNIAIVNVSIVLVNVAPIASMGNLDVDEDVIANGSLIATDGDNDALTYNIVSNGSKGMAVITNANTGAYRYTPNPDATGTDSFTFKANDGLLDSNIAGISVVIAAVNDVPIANNGSLNANEDATASGVLSASDADGDALAYSIVTNAGNGSAAITNAATGAYIYTPNQDATGIDSFTFKVNDGQLDSSTATITVNLAAVNDAPIANNGSVNTSENMSVNGVLSVSDVEGDALNISIVTNGAKGTVIITNAATGAYTYTPNTGATGVDSFTFKANDGQLDSNTATITVNIALVNFAPVANNGSLDTNMNTAEIGTLIANDVDGDTLVFSIVSNGLKGTAVITNPVTGAYTYTPDPGEVGADSFSFRVSDGLVNSNIAIVSVNIASVNTAPVANDASMNVDINAVAFGVLSASDADGDALTYSIVTNGGQGVAVITNAATGDFAYTSNAAVSGSDSFTFKVNDGQLDSIAATVSIQLVETASVDTVADNNDSGVSSGSINFLFIILTTILLGLRMRLTRISHQMDKPSRDL